MGYVRNMPWLTEGLLTDIKEDRAAAQYWQARYDALEPQRDTNGAIAEQKTELLALGADAAYRTAQREGSGDRQELLRRLDAALKSYTELLKKQGDADAAYNYEYIVRPRHVIQEPPSICNTAPGSGGDDTEEPWVRHGRRSSRRPDSSRRSRRTTAEHGHDAVQDAHTHTSRRAARWVGCRAGEAEDSEGMRIGQEGREGREGLAAGSWELN